MASPAGKKAGCLLLVLAALIIAATVWVSRNWFGESDVVLPVEDEITYEEIRATIQKKEAEGELPIPLGVAEKTLLKRYFEALGGIKTVSSVISLRFSGKVTFENGVVQELMVVKKGGDHMRTSVRNKTSQTTVVLSPEGNWRGVWAHGVLRKVEDLPLEEVEVHRNYIYVISELYQAMERGWHLSYLGQRDFNYKMAHVFEVRPSKRLTLWFYIDPETYLDVGREDRFFEPDGTLDITRSLHFDHFQAGKLTIPGRFESYKNGQLIQTLKIDQAQINSGVLDSAFDRPADVPTQ
jgi:hypothetical protein